jgi:hypothetical protein
MSPTELVGNVRQSEATGFARAVDSCAKSDTNTRTSKSPYAGFAAGYNNSIEAVYSDRRPDRNTVCVPERRVVCRSTPGLSVECLEVG